MLLIWRSEGAAGFFKGLQAQLLKTVLAAALMMMIKEKVTAGTRASLLGARTALVRVLARNALTSAPITRTSPARKGRSPQSAESALLPAIHKAMEETAPVLAVIRPLSVGKHAGSFPVRERHPHSHMSSTNAIL